MKNDDIIDNFGELPAEERTRLVAEQEAHLEAYNDQRAREINELEAKVLRLEALADEQERVADAMEELVERSKRIRAEKEALLAA